MQLTKGYLASLFMEVCQAKTSEELWEICVEFFKAFELKHGRISVFDSNHEVGHHSVLDVQTYPEGPDSWGEYYINSGLFLHDQSFHLIYELKVEELAWLEMDRLTRKGSEANRVFVEMRNFGIGDGLLVARSSQIHERLIMLGIAGAKKTFESFKGDLYDTLVQCFKAMLDRYLNLIVNEGGLGEGESRYGADHYRFKTREREIVRELSLDTPTKIAAANLNMEVGSLNRAVGRMKKNAKLNTREGLVGFALRTGQIQ